MSTLNSPQEVELAKRLIKIHKWSEMVRFSKSGGEACMIAIRIARAYYKKKKRQHFVAIMVGTIGIWPQILVIKII